MPGHRDSADDGRTASACNQVLVRLQFVDGLQIPETARVVGISENKAHVLESRARAEVRGQMRTQVRDDA